MPDPAAKLCWKCRQTKPLDDFWRDKSKTDGREGVCKQCKNQIKRERRAGVAPKRRRLPLEQRGINDFAGSLWHRLNRRTVNGARPRWTNKHIRYYLDAGVELRLTKTELYAFVKDNWPTIQELRAKGEIPTIDRIGPSIHYELGNIRVISLSENCRKSGRQNAAKLVTWRRSHPEIAIARKTKPTTRVESSPVEAEQTIDSTVSEEDRLLNRTETARLLGITTRTLDRWLATGDFPSPDCRVGPRRRLPDGKALEPSPRWRLSTVWAHVKLG